MPVELVHFINFTHSLCPVCKVPNSLKHLEFGHRCIIPDLETLLIRTKPYQEAKIPRRKGIECIRAFLKPLLDRMRFCAGEKVSETL